LRFKHDAFAPKHLLANNLALVSDRAGNVKSTYKTLNLKDSFRNYQAGVSSLFNRLLIALPFAAMTFVGVRARTQPNPFQFVTASPAQAKAMEAYVPYVTEAERTLQPDFSSGEVAAKKVATDWLAGATNGKLRQIEAPDYCDPSSVGVRREIVSANALIANTLVDRASEDLQNKNYEATADAAFLAAEVGRTTEMFDLYSVGTETCVQRDALSRLQAALPHLPGAEQQTLKARLHKLIITPADLQALVDTARTNALIYQAGWDPTQAGIQAVESDLPLSKLGDTRNFVQTAAWAGQNEGVSRTDPGNRISTVIRFAFGSANRTNVWLNHVISGSKL